MICGQVGSVEREMAERAGLVEEVCRLHTALARTQYNFQLRQRFDPAHHLVYCENFKVGSSTMATHLLTLNNLPLRGTQRTSHVQSL